jgi:hypothetical protein
MRDFTQHEAEISPLHTALRWHLLSLRTSSVMMRELAIFQCEGWKSIAKKALVGAQ